MTIRNSGWALAVLVFALAACGEKPQTLDADAKKVDAKAWEQSNSPFVAGGWKSGDKASWDEQLRARAQSQNEYVRTR